MRLNRAIFLDRDNTLNVDKGYTYKREDWKFIEGVPEALAKLKASGWLLIVVSNQSGIGRGFYTQEELHDLERYVNSLLPTPIDAWYHCPHLPEENCTCRKPAPGMLLSAANEWKIDLARSWMLGDRRSDILAGLAAGCKCGLIGGTPLADMPPGAKWWPTIREAGKWIREEK